MKAITQALKYANRNGYPDGGIVEEIAKHHGVKPENILLSAGSGEILDVVGTTFTQGGKKVVGVKPSYSQVYQHVTRIEGDAILLELTKDHRQDIPSIVRAAKTHYRDVGFVYLCNPNNPTGMIVTKQEVKQLLDGLPEDMPVLIDEAYHHFVDDPNYATSVPYVLEGRPVIIARTFSKIAARSEEHTSELQSRPHLVCRLLLEKKNYTSKSTVRFSPPGGSAINSCCSQTALLKSSNPTRSGKNNSKNSRRNPRSSTLKRSS